MNNFLRVTARVDYVIEIVEITLFGIQNAKTFYSVAIVSVIFAQFVYVQIHFCIRKRPHCSYPLVLSHSFFFFFFFFFFLVLCIFMAPNKRVYQEYVVYYTFRHEYIRCGTSGEYPQRIRG